MTGFLSNERVPERSIESEDIGGSSEQKLLDISTSERFGNTGEEVGPDL